MNELPNLAALVRQNALDGLHLSYTIIVPKVDSRTHGETLEIRKKITANCQRGSLQSVVYVAAHQPGEYDWKTFVDELTKAAMSDA